MPRLTLIVSFALACVVSGAAQSTGVKDPQAVSLINSCLSASGGSQAIGGVQDFVASGTATFNWDVQTQATAVLKERVSTNQFRFDATFSNGARSWAVSNGTGLLSNIDQTKTALTYQTAFSLRSLSWPVVDLVGALSDPAATISYVGLVSSDQGQAYQIHIQETYPAGADPSGLQSSASARDYFIDPKSFLLVEIKNTQASGNPPQNYEQSILFSGYTNVNGLMVPFSITETVAGQQTWVVQLNSVNFNVGLTDSDFQL
jgi:hypothetical protein